MSDNLLISIILTLTNCIIFGIVIGLRIENKNKNYESKIIKKD